MTMTFTVLRMLPALLVVACASAPPIKSASKEEISARTAAYSNCLIPYARQLDDRVSDARTIARSLVGACQPEHNSLLEASMRGTNDAVQRALRQQQPAMQEDHALIVVLQLRAAAR